MEELTPAEKHYLRLKEAQKRYYERNRAKFAEKSRIKYREKHPEVLRKTRPKTSGGF